MADPVLIPCLVELRREFDAIAPGRSKASDGWIGDTAHQAEVSDHNDDEVGKVPIHDADHVHEVHAADVTSDLRTPGLDRGDVIQQQLARCRSGAETRLRYMIYNRRIWEASNGWRQRAYTGPSPHTEHAHFSGSYDTSKEASTASWHLEELIMPTVEEIAKAVWSYNVALNGSYTARGAVYDSAVRSDAIKNTLLPSVLAAVGKDPVDEVALAAALVPAIVAALPGVDVTPEQLQAAIVGALRQLAAPAA